MAKRGSAGQKADGNPQRRWLGAKRRHHDSRRRGAPFAAPVELFVTEGIILTFQPRSDSNAGPALAFQLQPGGSP